MDVDTAVRTHRIAVVDTDDELVAVSLAFLRVGLAAGDLAVAVLPPRAAAHVREQLPGVEVLDLVAPSPREPEKTAGHLELLDQARSAGRRLRLLGQVHETDRRAWDERLRGEAVHEHVFADADMATLCLYDRRTTPPDVLAATLRAHPETLVSGEVVANPGYLAPADLVEALGTPVEPVQATEPVFAVDHAPSLPELRHQLSAALSGRLGDRDLDEDVHLAASEIAANAFRHGGAPVSARVWACSERVVVTIGDGGGSGFDGRLSGYRPAHGDDLSRGGMGLWLARKLCDHVDLERTATGLTVRLTTAVRRQA